jgi:hypothetical protein
MKNMRPSLLLILVGIDVSMSRARSGVRQFLSFVLSEYSLCSCDEGLCRSCSLTHFRSCFSASTMVSGMLKYPSRNFNGLVVLSISWKFMSLFFHPMMGFPASFSTWFSSAGQFSGCPSKRASHALVIAVKCADAL